jgi:hypothetical protein
MIYEERFTNLTRGSMGEYARRLREVERTVVHDNGGRVLCLMSGLIGSPANELLQVARYPDYASWQAAQAARPGGLEGLVESEEVRLLRAIAARPKDVLPPEDRRTVYGFRRFFTRAADLDEFAHCSGEGVWPRIEAQGACILGLWTTIAATDPQEVILLTGYHGPAHWEETRGNLPMPEGFDPELWERGRRLGARRGELTLKSWVKLMTAIELEEQPMPRGPQER